MARRATAEAARREAERALKAWVGNEFGLFARSAPLRDVEVVWTAPVADGRRVVLVTAER
jgi:hypothetical protein